MAQRINGGVTTARKLDIVNNLSPWETAAQAFLAGKNEIECPLCQKGTLQSTAVCGPDRIGFLLLTCPACGKSANFSRIKFPPSVETQNF